MPALALPTSTRHVPPTDPDDLWNWVYLYTGVRLARSAACSCHDAPFDAFSAQWFDRPPITLTLGARGSGKSYSAGILTHLFSRFHPGYGTRVLGGSKAQSEQVYQALAEAIVGGSGPFGESDGDAIKSLLRESATYRNGSRVSILAASSTSVRGPHVPALRLDEVDEIDPDIRESAVGMAMEDARRGYRTQIGMTSTWHRLGGPMAGLIEQAKGGGFPLFTFCSFDVLERCPASRSGPWVGGEAGYADCPACPLKPWCHAERDRNGDRPLAKIADGHYAIDSLIQKVRAVSPRVFESDYLCRGPKADGLWFGEFREAEHVRADANYDPALPVWLAVDTGVTTGAVFFQVATDPAGQPSVRVFADYLSENVGAEANARAILEIARSRCNGRLNRRVTDPAGGARNPIGPTVLAEYARVGLPLERWPLRPVADGLELVSSFLKSADGTVNLAIHPDCKATIAAFRSYRRARRAGQWMDYPEDPAHPAEDMLDSLRGGLCAAFPEGRKIAPKFHRVMPARAMY